MAGGLRERAVLVVAQHVVRALGEEQLERLTGWGLLGHLEELVGGGDEVALREVRLLLF